MEAPMQVSKWGNSLAVRLPKKLVEHLGIAEGDDVNVTSADAQTIVISKNDGKGDFLIKLRRLQSPSPRGLSGTAMMPTPGEAFSGHQYSGPCRSLG
jgi:antitoxin MazE